MKRELLYRPEALADLNEVEIYTKQTWGSAQAKKYAAALVADIKALRASAFRYPLHDEVYPGLRRKRSGMHHIYYLATDNRVEVLNIIHVQRDPGMHLKVETWRVEE
jgi:toxin ParE1/3/4